MARPRKKIDPEQVKKLAAINCSYAEMAAVLDCNESTLTRRFAQVIEKGREFGKMSLKRKQYEMAMSGNVTMLIWLGKQHLNQREQSNLPPVIIDNRQAAPSQDAILSQVKLLLEERECSRQIQPQSSEPQQGLLARAYPTQSPQES